MIPLLVLLQFLGLGPFTAAWNPDPPPGATALRLYVDDVLVSTLPPDVTSAPITVPVAGAHVLGLSAMIDTFETQKATFAFTALGTPPDQCTTFPLMLIVSSYTQTVEVGDEGIVHVKAMGPSPVTLIEVRLGTQVIGSVPAQDLRFLRAIGFGVPRTTGTYNLVLFAKDTRGCSAITTVARPLQVS